MIQIDQIRISVLEERQEERLREKAARILRIAPAAIRRIVVKRQSIDARRKPEVFYLYTVAVEVDREDIVYRRNRRQPHIGLWKEESYLVPERVKRRGLRPVVVGFGPAGLFASYLLALCGLEPVVLERGRQAQQRKEDVERFFATGRLDPASNVQFGEGGAGTFSDGKLATQKNDRCGRNRFVLETLHQFGADASILTDAKPHIGTDGLITVVENMRNKILALGGEVRFETCMQELISVDGRVTGVQLTDGTSLAADRVIVAIGHSARDTFERLYGQQIVMEAKPFAVGFRVEHPQERISCLQYGERAAKVLPPAPYKLTSKDTRRPLYSFCMCPGGYVINASSEPGRLCVNGMSLSDRGSGNANSALVMPVGGDFFSLDDPLAGMRLQRQLEEKVFSTKNGKIPQQLWGDYINNRESTGYGRFSSRTRGETALGSLRGLFPAQWEEDFIEGVRSLDGRMHGFWDEEMILSGVESRTSSPVRILRDARFEGSLRGLYPCGEGAGYAGGITSAAMDGLKVAEAVIKGSTD